jgi:hypothetical protein
MKKKSTFQSAFSDVRVLVGLFIFLALLLGLGVFFNASAQVNSDPKFAPWNPLVWLEQKVTDTFNVRFGQIGRQAGQFVAVHNVTVDKGGNIYTAEVNTGQRVQKFRRIDMQN